MTAPGALPIVPDMAANTNVKDLRLLLSQVDALAARMRQLSEENRLLRQQCEQVSNERAQLIAKNEQARSRVEAMIARLKSLEQHT